MLDNANSSDRSDKKYYRTAITAIASILFVYLYLISHIATDIFLFSITLILLLAALSFILEFASAGGFARLWIVAGIITIISSIAGLVFDSVQLISTYCGPECGASVSLKPFAITTAIIIGAIIYSIPQLRTRRWLRVVLSLILMGSAVNFGLLTMVL